MTMIRDHGWNTWDFRRLLGFVHLDRGRERLSVRVSFLDELTRERKTDFRWADLVRVGPHATDGSYTWIEIQAGFEAHYVVESAVENRVLHVRVKPTRTSGVRPVVEFAEPGTTHARREEDRIAGDGWCARATGALDRDRLFVSTDHPCFVGGRGAELTVACAVDPVADPDPAQTRCVLERARDAYAARALAGEGALADAPEALMRSVAWNTVYDFSGRGPCTLISRNWSMDWGTAVLFGWDTFFVAMMAVLEDPELAWCNLEAALAGATPEGFVPNWRFSSGAATLDRSHPPVGGLALARVFAAAPDGARLEAVLPGFIRWHRWWNRARDGRGHGLLSWGSSKTPEFAFPEFQQVLRHEAICAAYESGLDNSPTFDSVPFDAAAGTLCADDVGLNALHAAEGEALATLARRVGDRASAEALHAGSMQRRRLIQERLWNERAAVFANRAWNGVFCERIAPTSFYPLLAGAATSEQAAAMLASQLDDPDGFAGTWMLPSIRRDDPAFRDQDYWRGRIWPSMNWLAVNGLRRAGFHEPAWRVVASGLAMFLRAWRDGTRVHENYSALTGEGNDVPNSDPFYAWGSLLAALAIQELVDVGPDGSWTLASRPDFEAGVRHVRILGESWDVQGGPGGLVVQRSGEVVVESTAPCRITGYRPDATPDGLHVDAAAGTRVRMKRLVPNTQIRLALAGRTAAPRTDAQGALEIVVP